jgi:hypothetical protein
VVLVDHAQEIAQQKLVATEAAVVYHLMQQPAQRTPDQAVAVLVLVLAVMIKLILGAQALVDLVWLHFATFHRQQ